MADNALSDSAAGAHLLLTGERTVPGVAGENYWFRRHEAAYLAIAGYCADAVLLEAGCGEGYGAAQLGATARRVLALDYDESTVRHLRRTYPGPQPVRGDLAALPLRDSTVDVVVNLQVIEHLTDQHGFLVDCARVLRPGGRLLVSTPNRLTFSPGQDTPLNPFHTRELDPSELDELLLGAGFGDAELYGVHHGERLRALDAKYGGSLIGAQLDALFGSLPGEGRLPAELHADVALVRAADFELRQDDLAASLDLLAIAVRG